MYSQRLYQPYVSAYRYDPRAQFIARPVIQSVVCYVKLLNVLFLNYFFILCDTSLCRKRYYLCSNMYRRINNSTMFSWHTHVICLGVFYQ